MFIRGFLSFTAFLSLSFPASSLAKETLYLSLTPKNIVSSYLARMAAPPYHLVVTKTAPPSAIQSQSISADKLSDLGLFELEPGQTAPADAVCLRNVCLAHQTNNHHQHHFHMQSIEDSLIQPPPATQEASFTGLPLSLTAAGPDISISSAELKDLLEKFSGDQAIVVNGQEGRITERFSEQGRNLARNFLADEYRKLGYQVTFQSFNSGFSRGQNLIAEKVGSDSSKFYVVTSHMDTVRTAGADDDGSGTISALAIAKAIKNLRTRHSIRFVAFDVEEMGLVGSKAYAKQLADNGEMNRLAGLINLEMTAYDSDNDGAYHVIDCQENTSADLSSLLEQVISTKRIDLTKQPACTNRSDHAIFWRYNRPAVVVSQNYFKGDPNPCYHRRCDQTNQLNFDYMAKLTSAVAMTVRTLIQ